MPNFERLGSPILTPDGQTLGSEVLFPNSSILTVSEEHRYTHFRLRFSNGGAAGWWVDPSTIDNLIAELLYIRQDIKKYEAANIGFPSVAQAGDIEEPVDDHQPVANLDRLQGLLVRDGELMAGLGEDEASILRRDDAVEVAEDPPF